jgi:hypothetical protein
MDMHCPEDIRVIILEILRESVLRIRAAGWANDATRCAVLADHVHNLPELLLDYRPELLKYYWDATRPSFLKQCEGTRISLEVFRALWDRLQDAMKSLQEPAHAK